METTTKERIKLTSENEQKKKASNYTEDFKQEVIGEIEEQAELLRKWREFWQIWIPGGLRKRKRYRTPGHGKRKGINRRRNKAARAMRKKQRGKK